MASFSCWRSRIVSAGTILLVVVVVVTHSSSLIGNTRINTNIRNPYHSFLLPACNAYTLSTEFISHRIQRQQQQSRRRYLLSASSSVSESALSIHSNNNNSTGIEPPVTTVVSTAATAAATLSSVAVRDDNAVFFRTMRRQWPVRWQYFLRDSGLLRLIVDGSTILNAWTLVPTHQFSFAVSQYFKLSSHKRRYDKNVWKTWFQGTTTKTLESTILHLYSVVQKNLETDDTNPLYERRDDGYDSWNNETPLVVFEEFPYGSHPRQVLHVIRPTTTKTTSLLFFVHGGAWGSGFPELYRLVATPFVQVNYTVAILGYRTYPTSNVQGQVQDIANAIKTLVRKLQHSVPFNFNASHPKLDVTLMGHSSGAHLCSLGILQGQIRGVDRLVAIAGVYDIPTHYVYEASRGVERISPMAPACGGASLNRWRRCSPTYLLQKKRNTQHIHEDGEAAKNPHTFPPTLLCHGTADATVPYRQTINFFQAITQWYGLKHDVQLEILEEVEHSETVLQLMFGGPTLDVVLGWIQQGRTVQKESTTTK